MVIELCNYDKPEKIIKHADLKRSSKNSRYSSDCPVCGDGILMVNRHHTTFVLMEQDICVLCGQHFRYSDIAEMQDREMMGNTRGELYIHNQKKV
jgi:C4-type Zn-finger protein